MKRSTAVLLLIIACRPEAGTKRAGPASADTSLSVMLRARRDRPRGMTLRTPRVVTGPSVVVFWLPAGDTLDDEATETAVRELDYYTERVASLLAANGIALVPTNADTVYVEQPDHERRAIVLSGLDRPFGYLLVDPGGPERILTGVVSTEQLVEELGAYFDLPEDAD
ncbi:MAG: hypothetical protein ACREMF_06810, partial [Gemmatimonadales bacterium]